MSKKKRKIKIADADQIAQYGGPRGGSATHVEADSPDRSPEPSTSQPSAPQAPEGEGVTPGEEPSQDEAAELRAKIGESNDKHLRAVAELANFRRRATTERVEAVRYASADLIRALLPVVDDLERTLDAISKDQPSSLAEGVRLVHQNLLKALQAHHVERIEAVGRAFDPALHEAMMQQPSEEHPPSTVLEEYLPGYKLWDRVLRHSKVIVSSRPDGSPQEADDPETNQPAEGKDDRSSTDADL